MMQTQIPSGLQALIQASQVLSSEASQTAPGPQGPQPTVAERVNQQIKQVAQPQSPANMRDIGQQAGIAGQIMAQRQAQQQQAAQNPEAVAQMAAQMLQSQGVAGLPVKMGFKSGGIIGFSNGGDADKETIDRIRKEHGEEGVKQFLEKGFVYGKGDPRYTEYLRGQGVQGITVPLQIPPVEFSEYILDPKFANVEKQDRENFRNQVELINDLRKTIEKNKSAIASENERGDPSNIAGKMRKVLPEVQEMLAKEVERVERLYGAKPIGNDPTIAESRASIPLGEGYTTEDLEAYKKAVPQTSPQAQPAGGIASLVSAPAASPPARTAARPPAVVASVAQAAPASQAAPVAAGPRGIEQIVAEDERKKRASLAPLVQELKQNQQFLTAATQSGDVRSAQIYAQKVADVRRQLEEAVKKAGVSLESVLSAQPTAPAGQATPVAQAAPAAAAPTAGKPATPVAPAQAVPAAPGRAAPAAPRAAGPQSYADEVKARTEGILSGLSAPTTETILEQAKKIAPSDVDARIAEHRNLEAERDKLRVGQEELYKQAFETLQQDKEARKQLLKSRAERDQFNRVMAFARDLATNGTSYWNVQEGIFARQEADRLADLAHNKSILELKKAQQAEKVGDIDRKMGHLEKYNEWKDKATFYTLQAADLANKTQTSVYEKQVGARVSAADMLSREKIDKSRAEADAKKLGIMAQERKDAGLNNRIMMAQGRLTDAWKVYQKVKDDNQLGLSISEEDAKKDPTAKQMRDAALKAVKDTYDTVVTPAIETQNRLAEEVFGTGSRRSQPTTTADPLNIRG